MLPWAIVFAIIALLAGVLGFGGLAGDFAYIAKIFGAYRERSHTGCSGIRTSTYIYPDPRLLTRGIEQF